MSEQNKKRLLKGWKKGVAILTAATAIMANAVPVLAMDEMEPFYDIAADHWAHQAIYKLAQAEIVSGYDGGQFKASSSITRAEFTTIIVNALDLDLSNDDTQFEDISAQAWYRAAVAAASKNRLIHGVGENRFEPEASITRQDAAVVLANALSRYDTAITAEKGSSFTDENQIAAYAEEAVRTCVGYGIFHGNPDGTFLPQRAITRAEAAVIITAFVEMINGKELEMPRVVRTHASMLQLRDGAVKVSESQEETDATIFAQRVYEIYNGDSVTMGSVIAGKQEHSVCVERFELEGTQGKLIYFDASSKAWKTNELKESLIQSSCLILQTEEGSEYLIYTPKVYKHLENGSLEYLGEMDGHLEIAETNTGYSISVIAPGIPDNCSADYMYVHSVGNALFDWNRSNTLDYWSLYPLDGDARWCYDGFYFPAPSTYIPSGENIYYQCIAAYLCKSFAYGAPYHPVSMDLTIATLETMLRLQNDHGYFPTQSLSTWLLEDYNIGANFFDTRFNTDLIGIFHYISDWSDCKEFDESVRAYFEFFLAFAEDHHYETESGGWLVQDYWTPQAHKTSHSSLNHQVAEIILLYRYAKVFNASELEACADKMLAGIRDTMPEWIMRNGNLHYARYPDGTYGGVDYPYLTYNDLLELQTLLQKKYGSPNPYIQALMASKKTWMDANQISDYSR